MSKNSKEWDILDFASKATQIIEKNFKAILIIFIVSVVGGSAYVLKNKADASKEMDAFNKLYVITKVYQSKKVDFEEAKAQESGKKTPTDKTEKDPKKVYTKATGDMNKDYGDIVKQLEDFVSSNSGKNASGEAALVLSEIYEDYKQPEKAAAVITKALSSWSSKGLLFQVLNVRAGDLWAANNNCDKAVGYWQKIATAETFVSQQAQLKLGVCFQELGRIEEAKTWLNKVKSKTPNSTEGFSAKRYLRYIQFKNKLKPTNEKALKTKSKENRS